MKTYLPASRWSQAFNFTEKEFNDVLAELGLQRSVVSGGKQVWRITERGMQHSRMSRNPFKRVILWDFDAFFQAVKVKGKKSGEYFYCEKCGDYLSSQHGFEFGMKKWVCKKCGEVNSLTYAPPTEAAISLSCPECGKRADGIDEVIAVFGFEKDGSGRLIPKKVCKNCQR